MMIGSYVLILKREVSGAVAPRVGAFGFRWTGVYGIRVYGVLLGY
jgi:hypothetical protein